MSVANKGLLDLQTHVESAKNEMNDRGKSTASNASYLLLHSDDVHVADFTFEFNP